MTCWKKPAIFALKSETPDTVNNFKVDQLQIALSKIYKYKCKLDEEWAQERHGLRNEYKTIIITCIMKKRSL